MIGSCNTSDDARVVASNVQNYEDQIAKLQKATILSRIEKRTSFSSNIDLDAAPDRDVRAEVDAVNEIRIAQLMDENKELTQQINALYCEVEDLKIQKMERMECSFTSPIRRSLGPTFAALNTEDSVLHVSRRNQEVGAAAPTMRL